MRIIKKISLMISLVVGLSVFADPTVSDITAKQRYPWNGLVDITCKVSGIEGKRKFVVSAVMPDSGKAVGLKNFWVVRNGEKSTNFEVSANGDYRLLWDAKADLGEVHYDNMVVRITLDDIHDKVQLWEGGPYWATTNIGAEQPWESGYYFWWGGIIGYKHVTNPYSGWLGTNGSTSYNETFSNAYPRNSGDVSQLKQKGVITDNNVLSQGYDAAFMHWGKRWRMPTHDEANDLKNKCEWKEERINGVVGYIVRGKGVFSAFSIFLPRGGRGSYNALNYYGTQGYYWTSSPHGEYYDASFCLQLSNSSGYEASVSYTYRFYGCNIRPVQGGEAVYALYDSAPFILDTTDPLITSPITYNSSWLGNNSEAVVVIADNGVEVKRVAGEGEFTYSPTTPGKHTLTYTTYIDDVAQSEVYSATIFADWKYTVEDGKATIVETTHKSGDVIIPSEIDGHSVVGIYDGLFAGCNGIVDVTLPGGLAERMAEMFPDSYASITNVVLTGGVAQIPAAAFSGCGALESVTLAENGVTLALGGDKGWRFDENGILRSGKITDNESSSMSMAVQGEGRLTYRWKASSEYYKTFISDYAYLVVDGVAKGTCESLVLGGTAIGGATDWQEVSIDIENESAHQIDWIFVKNDNDVGIVGEDCVWVDAIAYEPFIKVSFDIAGAEGMIPAFIKDVPGASVTLPTSEGFAKATHTLTGWSDGVQTYEPGSEYQIGATNVVLAAVYSPNTLAVPVISSDDVVSGGEITSASATVEISAEDGTTVYYTLDGTDPTSESLLYGGAFEAEDLGLVTVKAIAVRENCFDSEVAEFSFTRRPYSAAECLNANGMTFTLGGDVEWSRVLDGDAHDGDAAMRSGAITDNQACFIETKVSGAGTISFWWKSSCEVIFNGMKFDYASFAVDGIERECLAGVGEWTNVSVEIAGSGEHTLRWVYQKDSSDKAGEDCAWLDEVVWTPDPIPELSATATAGEVAAALEGSVDAKLIANITDAATYAAYRTWALGLAGVTPDAVKASPNAWLSYALNTAALIAFSPKEGDVVIDTFESTATDGAFEFAVKIDGIAVGDNASAANIRKVFDIEGAEKLVRGGVGFSSDNVEVNVAAPEDGNVKFTVTPKGGALGTTRPASFFFRVKMK